MNTETPRGSHIVCFLSGWLVETRELRGKHTFKQFPTANKMSKSVFLREAITERLTAAADEIFGTVEKIVAEYQEEISRSKEENERLRRLLDIAIKPVIKLHRTADPQLITSTLCEEKALTEEQNCDQEWNPSVENLEPPQIKEEQYLCTSQQQPQELKSDLKESTFSSTCMKRDDQNSHHSHLHQTLTEEKRVRDPLPINTAGDIKMGPHGDPQPFTHPMCEEESLPEEEWSPGLEQENLEPPRIKEEHDLWTSQEQPHMLRFIMKDSISSSPCASDQHPHLHQSQTDENRERDPLPTNTAGDIQMYPDGGDNDPQPFSHPVCEEESLPEEEWSPGLEQENLEPPRIKEEHHLWTSQEQPHMLRFIIKDSISSSPCASDQHPHLHQSQTHTNRERNPLPTNTARDNQMYPDGGDTGELELTSGCSFWEKQMPTNQCKYCGKCYKRKGELNRHERVHTGKEPYQCKYCGKLFNHKGDLNRHEVVHTGHKPYRCKYCGICYTKRAYLTKHEVNHTEERLGLLAGLWLEQMP